MHAEQYREFCLTLPNVEECMPFDESTLVYKIGGKIFTLTNLSSFKRISVKCDPELAIELRERHAGITPGWHLNKKHWNDIYLDASFTHEFIKQQIIASYLLVIKTNVTPKNLREQLMQNAMKYLEQKNP